MMGATTSLTRINQSQVAACNLVYISLANACNFSELHRRKRTGPPGSDRGAGCSISLRRKTCLGVAFIIALLMSRTLSSVWGGGEGEGAGGERATEIE